MLLLSRKGQGMQETFLGIEAGEWGMDCWLRIIGF